MKSIRAYNEIDAVPNKTRLIEMLDDGVLDAYDLALELIAYISDDDAADILGVYVDDFDEEY